MVCLLSTRVDIRDLEAFRNRQPAEQHTPDFPGDLCLHRHPTILPFHIGDGLAGFDKIPDSTDGHERSGARAVHHALLPVPLYDSRNPGVRYRSPAVYHTSKSMAALCLYDGIDILSRLETRPQRNRQRSHVTSRTKVLLCKDGINNHLGLKDGNGLSLWVLHYCNDTGKSGPTGIVHRTSLCSDTLDHSCAGKQGLRESHCPAYDRRLRDVQHHHRETRPVQPHRRPRGKVPCPAYHYQSFSNVDHVPFLVAFSGSYQ